MEKSLLTGNEVLGIELGSTRIKAVLINDNFEVLATGSYAWENKLVNGYWSYDYEDILNGVRYAYKDLSSRVLEIYNSPIYSLKSMGVSAMMHGYLPLDSLGNPLCEFRTWRNTSTKNAAEDLTNLFKFNIPQRWSVAHLYQAILNGEKHISRLNYLTTLAGYVHYMLTGEKVIGIGDASGMFPLDYEKGIYNENMLSAFSQKREVIDSGLDIRKILPKILKSGENAGFLTEKGASMLDPTGNLKCGIPLCPPEGDAGTGMVATNCIKTNTGNISAGTSMFSMVVVEKSFEKVYEEIDFVATPSGDPVAMVHCNNCSTDIDHWINLFSEFADKLGISIYKEQIYEKMFNCALEGESDCGGLISYSYFSGEPVTKIKKAFHYLFVLQTVILICQIFLEI